MGIVVFAVVPGEASQGWSRTLALGAMFGFFAYATYDLTNLATLKNWPISVTLEDRAWGSLVSAISAAAGKVALDKLA